MVMEVEIEGVIEVEVWEKAPVKEKMGVKWR